MKDKIYKVINNKQFDLMIVMLKNKPYWKFYTNKEFEKLPKKEKLKLLEALI
jgi:hypothetical protein